MATKKQTTETKYTAEERRRFLFRTASEMREILERVEMKQAERHGNKVDQSKDSDA